MNVEIIKVELNPKDDKSLLYWQNELYKEIIRCEEEDDIPAEDVLDMYDYIMEKLAWMYINEKMAWYFLKFTSCWDGGIIVKKIE